MDSVQITKQILADALQLGSKVESFDRHTELAGALPELNSLTIVSIITAIEEQLDCTVDDEELEMEIFETVGTLADFIETKI